MVGKGGIISVVDGRTSLGCSAELVRCAARERRMLQ
jgi:hypothetical protein